MTTHRLVPLQYFLNILPCTNICFYRQNPAQSDFFISTVKLAWENSWHLAMLPLVSPPNDPDLGSASHWLNQISHVAQPIRRTTQIWVVTCHQYGISALISQTSCGNETSGSIAKCRPFSQATVKHLNPDSRFLSKILAPLNFSYKVNLVLW